MTEKNQPKRQTNQTDNNNKISSKTNQNKTLESTKSNKKPNYCPKKSPRRQSSHKPKTNKISTISLTIILLALPTPLNAIPTPSKTTLSNRQFTHLSDFPSASTTTPKALAATSNGELYSIDSSLTSTKLTFKKSNGNPFNKNIKNMVYTGPKFALAIYFENTANQHWFQLFEAASVGATTLTAKSGLDNSGPLHDKTNAAINKNHMDVIPQVGTLNYIVLVANSNLEILMFKGKAYKLDILGGSKYNVAGKVECAFLLYNDEDTFQYGVVLVKLNGGVYHIETYTYSSDTIKYNFIQTWSKGAGSITSNSPILMSPYGIRYKLRKWRHPRLGYMEKLVYVLKDRTIYVLVTKLKERLSFEGSTQLSASYFPIGIKSVSGTVFGYTTVLSKNYVQGGAWNSVSDFSKLVFFEHFYQNMDDSGARVRVIYEREYTTAPLGALSFVSSTGEVIIASNWHSQPNLFYTEKIMNLGCPVSQTAYLDASNIVQCSDTGTIRPNCLKPLPVSLGCLECSANTTNTKYTLYDTSSITNPNFHSCRRNDASCDNSAGKYQNPDGATCYTCSAAVSNCAECVDFSQTCLKCSAGFGLVITGGVAKCSSCTVSGCLRCKTGSPGTCEECEVGKYLKTPTNCETCSRNNCKECTRTTNWCKVCNDYHPQRTGTFASTLVEVSCANQCANKKFTPGQGCLDCEFTVPNNNCLRCGAEVDSCTACGPNTVPNPSNNNVCEPGCVDGQYLNGSNQCKLCTSVNSNTQCKKCNDGAGQCTECNAGYQLDDNKFCFSCPSGQYWKKNTKQCKACSTRAQNGAQCTACDAKSGVCSACSGDTTLNAQKICQKNCAANEYWEGTSTNSCKSCASRAENGAQCTACDDQTGVCSACAAGYTLDENKFCRKNCLANEYFLGTGSNSCQACNVPTENGACDTCTGVGQCTKCLSGYFPTNANKCINEANCPATKYLKSLSGGKVKCQACSALAANGPCTSCRGTPTNVCTACQTGFSLNSNKFCQRDCLSGDQYWSGAGSNECLLCTQKLANCKECQDEAGPCTKCLDGFDLVDNGPNKFCKRRCEAGDEYWTGFALNSCRKCSLKVGLCVSCEDESGPCLTCQGGYRLRSGTFCALECLVDEFWTGEALNTCRKCSDVINGCSECTEITGACSACQNGLILAEMSGGNFCRSQCPKNQFWAGTALPGCQACSQKTPDCLECEEATGTCQKCSQSYQLSQDSKKCEKIEETFEKSKKEETYPTATPAPTTNSSNSNSNNLDQKESTLELVNKIFSKSKSQVELVFSQIITAVNKDSFIVTFETTKNTINTVNSNNQAGTTTISLETTQTGLRDKKLMIGLTLPEGGLKNGTIVVQTPTSPNLGSRSQPVAYFYDFPVKIENISTYEINSVQEPIKNVGFIMGTVMMIQAFILSFLSFPLALMITQLLQIIDLIRLIDVDLPANVKRLIQYFSGNLLEILGSPIKFDEDITRCRLADIFAENDISCLAFNNTGIFFVVGFLIFLLILIVHFLEFLVKNCSRKRRNRVDGVGLGRPVVKKGRWGLLLGKIRRVLDWELLGKFGLIIQMDILLGAFVPLRYGEKKDLGTRFNYGVAVIIILVYLVYFGFLVILTTKKIKSLFKKPKSKVYHQRMLFSKPGDPNSVQNSPNEKEKWMTHKEAINREIDQKTENSLEGDNKDTKNNKNNQNQTNSGKKRPPSGGWEFLFEEVKQEPVSVTIIPLTMLLELITIPVVVYAVDTATWQILPLLLLYLLAMAFLLYRQPFLSCVQNFVISTNIICYFILLILMLVLESRFGKGMGEKARYYYIGGCMIFLIILAIASNLALGLYSLVEIVVNFVRGASSSNKSGSPKLKQGSSGRGVMSRSKNMKKAEIKGGLDLDLDLDGIDGRKLEQGVGGKRVSLQSERLPLRNALSTKRLDNSGKKGEGIDFMKKMKNLELGAGKLGASDFSDTPCSKTMHISHVERHQRSKKMTIHRGPQNQVEIKTVVMNEKEEVFKKVEQGFVKFKEVNRYEGFTEIEDKDGKRRVQEFAEKDFKEVYEMRSHPPGDFETHKPQEEDLDQKNEQELEKLAQKEKMLTSLNEDQRISSWAEGSPLNRRSSKFSLVDKQGTRFGGRKLTLAPATVFNQKRKNILSSSKRGRSFSTIPSKRAAKMKFSQFKIRGQNKDQEKKPRLFGNKGELNDAGELGEDIYSERLETEEGLVDVEEEPLGEVRGGSGEVKGVERGDLGFLERRQAGRYCQAPVVSSQRGTKKLLFSKN